ncbi:Dehydrogenase xptC [Lachnellula suecica]|uniref:Dehydrogenase xptC n=1 Tax=Lachnellula suecica TaxID=602035 RepID=A0A8T9C3V1_9HELO|nr:Dehydrogenase xptC [Lachnellula suecica]
MVVLNKSPLLVATLSFSTLISSIRLDGRDVNGKYLDCYDYIIVGGGVSGLVVANRLTEDPNVTVLVLEAGPLCVPSSSPSLTTNLDYSDNYEEEILYPIDAGYGLGTKYDWNLFTAPQTSLDGQPRPYDIGRGVGGGSLINGMCWTRGGSADYDAWEALGNPGWGWDGLLPYFKKTENYTNDIDADFSHKLYVQPDPSVHGTEGYVQVSYPRYFYNQSQVFLEGLQELGVPILTEPANGTAAGGMLIPNSINPDNQTRSTARLSYFDRFIDTRPNLHVATNQHVFRLIVDAPRRTRLRDYPDGLWISGVQFIPDGTLSIQNVSCSREVILSAGAVHTPQILEFSGIGDPNVLNQFDIPVKINIPGVGNNFQDHPYLGVVYYVSNTSFLTLSMIYNNPTLLTQAEQEYYVNKTGPWTAGAINTVAFPSLPSTSNNWTHMIADASSQDASKYLVPNLDPTIIAGFQAQKAVLVGLLNRSDVSAYELLSNSIGLLSVAAMHTFSRGNVHIQSRNPFMEPLIDPRYCSNPLDCQVIVEGLLFNNKLLNTSSMRQLGSVPYYPFLPDATPQTLLPAVQSGIRTEFHGTGSTSMLPLEHGGVVDSHLRVYGTKNLRIVDAGIMPLVPASHLQAPMYAVAEKAADIIKADNAGLTPQSCGSNSSFARPGPVMSNSSARGLTLSPVSPVPSPSTFQQLLNVSAFMPLNTSTRWGSVGPSGTPQSVPIAQEMLRNSSNSSNFRQTSNTSRTVSNPIADVMSIFFTQSSLSSTPYSSPSSTFSRSHTTAPSSGPALAMSPLSNPFLALPSTVTAPNIPVKSVAAPVFTTLTSSQGLSAVGGPLHKMITSEVGIAYTALPHGLFAAEDPYRDMLASKVVFEIDLDEA